MSTHYIPGGEIYINSFNISGQKYEDPTQFHAWEARSEERKWGESFTTKQKKQSLMEEQMGTSTGPMARERRSVWVWGDNTR